MAGEPSLIECTRDGSAGCIELHTVDTYPPLTQPEASRNRSPHRNAQSYRGLDYAATEYARALPVSRAGEAEPHRVDSGFFLLRQITSKTEVRPAAKFLLADTLTIHRVDPAHGLEGQAYSKKSFEDGSRALEQPLGAKSLEQVIRIQSEYARMVYEAHVAEVSKLGEMYAGLTRNAYRPVEQAAAKTGAFHRPSA